MKRLLARFRKSPTQPAAGPVAGPAAQSRSRSTRSRSTRSRSTRSRSARSRSRVDPVVLSRPQAESQILGLLQPDSGADPAHMVHVQAVLDAFRVAPSRLKYLDEAPFQQVVEALRARIGLFRNAVVQPRSIPLAAAAPRPSAGPRVAVPAAAALSRAHILDRFAMALHPNADPVRQRKILTLLHQRRLSAVQLKTLSDADLAAVARQVHQQTGLFA